MGNELIDLCSKKKVGISNESTFHFGIENLLLLRKQLLDSLLWFKRELDRADFNTMLLIGEDGFHRKTIFCLAYSINEIKHYYTDYDIKR